jgi:hypothetical protein
MTQTERCLKSFEKTKRENGGFVTVANGFLAHKIETFPMEGSKS